MGCGKTRSDASSVSRAKWRRAGSVGAHAIFSDNQINSSAQYQQTTEKIGYVVIDIDAASSDLALDKLAKVGGTLRSRVLF